MNKLISVIIPIYDRTDLLTQAIESILYQDYQNFELLLIMDKSPEETKNIVMSYKYNPHVRIFETETNTGTGVIPRNIGLVEGCGEYVAFMDSDDLTLPGRFVSTVNALQDADIVYSDYNILDHNTGELKPIKTSQCTLDLMLNIGCYACQSTVGAKREVLLKLGGLKSKFRWCEDYELWCRALYAGYKMKYIPETWVTYRLHDNNLEKKVKDVKWKDELLKEYKIIPDKLDLITYKKLN